MQAHFIKTPTGFAFEFPEHVLKERIVSVEIPPEFRKYLRDRLFCFLGKTINVFQWERSPNPTAVIFIDHRPHSFFDMPEIRPIPPELGIYFHNALSCLDFPKVMCITEPDTDNIQTELILMK